MFCCFRAVSRQAYRIACASNHICVLFSHLCWVLAFVLRSPICCALSHLLLVFCVASQLYRCCSMLRFDIAQCSAVQYVAQRNHILTDVFSTIFLALDAPINTAKLRSPWARWKPRVANGNQFVEIKSALQTTCFGASSLSRKSNGNLNWLLALSLCPTTLQYCIVSRISTFKVMVVLVDVSTEIRIGLDSMGKCILRFSKCDNAIRVREVNTSARAQHKCAVMG